MTYGLGQQGHGVNVKRVRRLMRRMGLEAIYPKPRRSVPGPGHRIYPYRLRGLKIDRPNQVGGSDITYIRLRQGFIYRVAILDWVQPLRGGLGSVGIVGERLLSGGARMGLENGTSGDLQFRSRVPIHPRGFHPA